MTDDHIKGLAAIYGLVPSATLMQFARQVIDDKKTTVPTGWKVVPVYPSERQLTASANITDPAAKYRRQIEAAPHLLGFE